VVSLVAAVGTALVLLVGGLRVESGQISLGALILVISYLGQLFGPIQTLSKQPVKLQSQIVSAARVVELLDERPEVEDRADSIAIERVRGAFSLRDVSFAYDQAQPVLSKINIEVPAGAKVGVIGRTGAGKSTLASLLIRFYDVSSGAILLDGIDIRDCRLKDLRNQFTMVLQDPFLFSTSIAENVAFGRPTASLEAIQAAAAAAGIHDFVEGLPEGYDTVVGERGMRLSGGERQRISLARAFLKDAPILLLDEPTSSVDVGTEAEIMEAMERLMTGRTTFMIAHRVSTLRSCDMVIEIGDGRAEVIGDPEGRPRSPQPVDIDLTQVKVVRQ
jgi:ATP-binding cassette subfamily B protein